MKNLQSIVIIKQIKNLPKLGLYTSPSPYMYAPILSINVESQKHLSINALPVYIRHLVIHFGIRKLGLQLMICLRLFIFMYYFASQFVQVFNSNSNSTDQLIAYGNIQFQHLLTAVPTPSKIILQDAKNNRLHSQLTIQHSNQNPALTTTPTITYNQQTIIRINLLRLSSQCQQTNKWVQKHKKTLSLTYANKTKQLSYAYPQILFRYSKNQHIIKASLMLADYDMNVGENMGVGVEMEDFVNVLNVCGNACVRCGFYWRQHEVSCLLCVTVLKRGYLPDNMRILGFQVVQLGVKPDARKKKNWWISVSSVYTKKIIKNVKDNVTLYIENGTDLKIDYYQQINEKQINDAQPLNTYILGINAINWSEDYEANQTINVYNSSKGYSLTINCKLSLLKSQQQLSVLQPKLMKPDFTMDMNNLSYRINSIKLSGLCFSEIFNDKTIMHIFYVANKNNKIYKFASFQLKNTTEYLIYSKQVIENEKGGVLYLVTFDYFFGVEQDKYTFDRHYVCKVEVDDLAVLSDAKIMYNQKFLSFAKKITVTKVCKKYDQMIRDRTLVIQANLKQIPTFRPGSLTIHNCILEGSKNNMKFTVIIDENQFVMQGTTDRYMLHQPYRMQVKSKDIIMKLEYSQKKKQLYSDFQQIFGTPSSPNNLYKIQFPISGSDKLNLIYSYQEQDQSQLANQNRLKLKQKNRHIQQQQPFRDSDPLSIKLKSLKLLSNETYQSFILKIVRADTIIQSQQYSPSSNQIKFVSSEKMLLPGSNKKIIAQNKESKENKDNKEESKGISDSRYIFFNVYCTANQKVSTNFQGKNQQIQGEQKLKKTIIYTGYIDVQCMMGKGEYQIMLAQIGENANKSIVLCIEVLNIPPLRSPAISYTIKSLECFGGNNTIFKQAFKYYLVVQVNYVIFGIFEGRRDTNISQNMLKIEENMKLKNGDKILWKLYSSLRSLTKQLFWSAQKELIGSGVQFWTQINIGDCYTKLRFRPTRQLKNNYNANKLSLLENNISIILSYNCTAIEETSIEILRKKPRALQLDVLHSGAGILSILQIFPAFSTGKNLQFSINSSKQTLCKFCCFAKLPLHQQYVIDITNMKLNMQVNKNYKINENYLKQSQSKQINLHGKHLKTNDKFGLNLNYPGICSIKAQLTVVSNKFTNNCNGKLILRHFQFKGDPLRGIEIYCLNNARVIFDDPASLQKLQPLRFNLQNKTGISLDNRQIRTNSIAFCLYIILVSQNKTKTKTVIQLAKIDIDKLQQKQFKHQWLVEGNNKLYTLCLTCQYFADSMKQQLSNQAIKYQLQNYQQIKNYDAKFNKKQYEDILKDVQDMMMYRPDRKRGFRIFVEITDRLRVRSALIVLEDGGKVGLLRNQHNKQIFTLKSEKEYKIKTIGIDVENQKDDKIDKIEELEAKNFNRRFLINRDNRYIAYLTEQPYAIADIQPQSCVISFTFHAIKLSKDEQSLIAKKIMWMDNNKNDQILTRYFGLYVRHGSQCQAIRVISQDGSFLPSKNSIKTIKFGYQPQIDQLQFYLYIHHELNQNEDEESLSNFQELLSHNWIKYLPVSYGKLSIEKIGENTLVGCQLKPVSNDQETVDSALNKVIIRPELNCLGAIRMQKKKWGYINIKFIESTPIQLQFKQQKQLIYFIFSIQNTRKQKIQELRTEARQLKLQSIKFSQTNSMKFKFIEQKSGEMYNMKITANIVSTSNHYTLFEKRADMTQYLSQSTLPNTKTQKQQNPQTFNIKIKTSQANGLKQPIQLAFQFSNTDTPYVQYVQTITERAKAINNVDIVSFQDHSEQSLVVQLLRCQHSTHLMENMTEVRESVLYSKEQKKLIFITAALYLRFQNASKFIDLCLQILNLELIKYDSLLPLLQDQCPQFSKDLYLSIKTIASLKQLPLQKPTKTTQQNYEQFLTSNLSQSGCLDTNLTKFYPTVNKVISMQKQTLCSPQQQIQAASFDNIEKLIILSMALCKQSSQLKAMFISDMAEFWNQCFLFKQDRVYLMYLNLVESVLLKGVQSSKQKKSNQGSNVSNALEIRTKVIVEILESTKQRNVGTVFMVEIWTYLPQQDRKQYSEVLAKFLGKNMNLQSKNNETINSIRAFLNYLLLYKYRPQPENVAQILQKCIEGVQNSTEIRQLTSFCELIFKLKHFKYVQQKQQGLLYGILKKKKQNYQQKSKKFIITNLMDKLMGKEPTGDKTKDSSQQSNKNHFYKKYLITS